MVQHIGECLPKKTSSNGVDVWQTAARAATGGMDKRLFLELMRGLWAGAGRKDAPDTTTLRVWYLCLSDLSVEEFSTAVRRYLTERSADYLSVQLIRELSGVTVSGEAAAILAWDEVVEAVRIYGSYRVPMFRDPATSHVVKHLGGWAEICGTEPTELRKWTRQAFCKAYRALQGAVSEPAELRCLLHVEPELRRVGVAAERLRIEHREAKGIE